MKFSKRIVFISLVLVMLLGAIPFLVTYGDSQLVVSVNGHNIDFCTHPPVVQDGQKYVPIGNMFYAVGFDVLWYETGCAVLAYDGVYVLIPADANYILVNEVVVYPVYPQALINDYLMMTVDSIADIMGGYVVHYSAEHSDIRVDEIQLPYVGSYYETPSEPSYNPEYTSSQPSYNPEYTSSCPYVGYDQPYTTCPTDVDQPYDILHEPAELYLPIGLQATAELQRVLSTPRPTIRPVPGVQPTARPSQRPPATQPSVSTPIPPRAPRIPRDRRISRNELNAWIDHYHAQGGSNSFEYEVIRLINEHRVAAGMHELEISPTLMMTARFKSQAMADMAYMSHINPVYGNLRGIPLQLFGYPEVMMGENLGRWHHTPQAFVDSLMSSESHRVNLLRPQFIEVGVGFYQMRWTQHFGTADTSNLPPPTTAPW